MTSGFCSRAARSRRSLLVGLALNGMAAASPVLPTRAADTSAKTFLQQISAATNGKFYKLGEWDNWRKDLHVAEQHFSRVELTDLWNNPILIASVMALLTAEWITRKRWNLP